ncbi:tRNA (cytosine(72)-C(5))-methyltransferase NSUN6 isoform X2 [Sitodiplosis mosellana]|uniref:tRNA (cytosine(72)-C(5))-methyltransferase NSUN6 isoform X2 n=1 Tax=Sitodiplosis mosellana TaxID=263140 RepID=UPI0024442B41|nr:tRNA (cytosine(72)-C(5))-methyltransferase NSUN6 isoform X2 [Sitodiplosis mosellana]
MEHAITKLFDGTTLSGPQIEKLVKWLQVAPKTTTIRVNLLHTSTDNVISYILETLEKCDLPGLPIVQRLPDIPEMIIIHSIDKNLINRLPKSGYKEIIVDVCCAAAVLRGAHIYCPGILAMQSNTKLDEMVNIFADVEGACRKGTNIVYSSKSKLFVGIGQVKMQRFQLFRSESKGIAVRVHETVSCVPSIGSDYLVNQQSLLQNFPSIVCSRVLSPKPNEIILDMCASPGNKTTHIAQLMQDTGLLIALDKSKSRVAVLKENIQRFKLKSVHVHAYDATKALSKLCKDNWLPPFTEESFDRILLDAPCSGMGNRPVLATKMSPNILSSFPKLQKKLLDTAVKLLKINGTLVYSTCSVMEAENELNVAYILEKYGPQIELETANPLFGRKGLPNTGLSDV